MKDIKIFIANSLSALSSKILRDHFTIVFYEKESNFNIVSNTFDTSFDPKKCILILSEPPITRHRKFLYNNKSKFHTVLTFNPESKNEFSFSRNPVIFPYNPYDSLIVNRSKDDMVLKSRKIYYAGHNGRSLDTYKEYTNLYSLRLELITKLYQDPNFDIRVYGNNWQFDTKKTKYDDQSIKNQSINYNWRSQKIIDMDNIKSEFVLSLENCILPGYISEKFHDGLLSDRVMLYLGEPNISNYVLTDCFVDLRAIYKNNTIDPQDIFDIINSFSVSKYREMIDNARDFRKSIKGMWLTQLAKTTEFIANRIKDSI